MAFLVVLFVVALASQHIAAQVINTNTVSEVVNTNVPQINTNNNFFVTFGFEDVAPNCCPGPLPSCGDGKCNTTENCVSCPQDCKCLYCGDGLCLKTDNETCTNCPVDCGACSSSVNVTCGDGVCTSQYESCRTCQVDCGACVVCGDGVCSYSENCDSCPLDCGGPCPSGALVGGTVDLLTNLPVQGATVQTLNVRPGNEFSMTTNQDGNFYFLLLPVQVVQLQVTHPLYGYATATVQIPLNGIANITIYLAPRLPNSAWQIELTWGANPPDLDLTMFGDWSQPPYQNGIVNFESANKTAALPFALYGGDVSTGYGPEFIYINKFGTPRQNTEIWVNNYSGERRNASLSFIMSSARVTAFSGSLGIQADFSVNATALKGDETWWHVFDITPAQQVVAVNQFFNTLAAPCGWIQYCPYRPADLFFRRK